jgi:hypothetical protein
MLTSKQGHGERNSYDATDNRSAGDSREPYGSRNEFNYEYLMNT